MPRDDAETHLNLRDTWARVYLARACAVAIQSPYVAGGRRCMRMRMWIAAAHLSTLLLLLLLCCCAAPCGTRT